MKKLPYIIIAILVSIVIYLYLNQPEPVNDRIGEYEKYIDSVNTKIEAQELRITQIQQQRDSSLLALQNKMVKDQESIKKKYDKKRSDILVLNDDESVKLLTTNLARR